MELRGKEQWTHLHVGLRTCLRRQPHHLQRLLWIASQPSVQISQVTSCQSAPPAGDNSHLLLLLVLETPQPFVSPVPSVLCMALCGKHCFLVRLINTWGQAAPTLATVPQGSACVFLRIQAQKRLMSMEIWRQHRDFLSFYFF